MKNIKKVTAFFLVFDPPLFCLRLVNCARFWNTPFFHFFVAEINLLYCKAGYYKVTFLHRMLSVMGLLIPSPSMLCATHVYIPDWWRFTFWRTKLWLLTMIPAVGLEIKGVSYKDRKIMMYSALCSKFQWKKWNLGTSYCLLKR